MNGRVYPQLIQDLFLLTQGGRLQQLNAQGEQERGHTTKPGNDHTTTPGAGGEGRDDGQARHDEATHVARQD